MKKRIWFYWYPETTHDTTLVRFIDVDEKDLSKNLTKTKISGIPFFIEQIYEFPTEITVIG